MINIQETHMDLANLFKDLLKFKINSIYIKGYYPFFDSHEEYHPQYNINYITKIIAITRLIFPSKIIKMQASTKNTIQLKTLTPLGINTIIGVYFNKYQKSIYNINEISNIIKK